jgi:LEA14-like dessication related protein
VQLTDRQASLPSRRCHTLVLLSGVLLLVGSSACRTLEPPTIAPHAVRVAAVSMLGLDVDVEVQVDNPNSIPLLVEAVDGTLFVGAGQRLGHGSAKPAHGVPAHASSLVQSRLRITWDDLAVLAPFMAAEVLPYTLQGDVTLGGESVHLTLPFSLQGQLTRTQLLSAGMRGL